MIHSVLPPPGDPDLHFWITQSVARSVGLRFSDAMQRGLLSEDDFAALVTACQKCPYVEFCVAHLGEARALGEVPEFCANKDALEMLAAQVQDRA